jgi:23S rRNA pseudouridine2605 synthase
MEDKKEVVRLNKYVALSGICTRKDAVDIVKKGFISVNHSICYEPFYEVKPEDVITYKGKSIEPKKQFHYFILNKPKNIGEIVNVINKGTTINNLLKVNSDTLLKQIFVLSDESCGLTILTDDNEVLQKYASEDQKYKSVFEIQTEKNINAEEIKEILNSVNSKNHFIKGISHIQGKDENVLGVEMIGGSEAKMMAFLDEHGIKVTKSDRTFIKGLTKKDLKRGWSRPLTEKEVIFLKYF